MYHSKHFSQIFIVYLKKKPKRIYCYLTHSTNHTMKYTFFFLTLMFFYACLPTNQTEKTMIPSNTKTTEFALVIHGGAGTILKENMTPELEKQYHNKLRDALLTGYNILENGGTSIDAVEATIMLMEDSPLFNAGKGAVFTNDGHNELDASFMDGATQNAGAVGGVRHVKNPIQAARAVLEKSKHVMLTGAGADAFAKSQGIEMVDTSYFYTERRWKSLQNAKRKEGGNSLILSEDDNYKYGTVGAAALDKSGNLAAGTSTGGMTNKRYGRIGDSPIIGAGTYANNATCAVSSTGHGEYFMRYLVAYDISARMEYAGEPLEKAADMVINDKLKAKGGSGGVIAIDKYGNIAMPFNTAGMYRGYVKADGAVKTFLYKSSE